jgi:adenine-specific DNA methylase
MSFNYYDKSCKSLGHTAIYKTHKYFARRPHNVFRELIRHYSNENDIIFDPFGGGGVTLVEGLSENRRVISSDINPIASFIQLNQVANIELKRFRKLAEAIKHDVESVFGDYFLTDCVDCESTGRIRWIEHAYTVQCPHCNSKTVLKDKLKAVGDNGRPKNGFYVCESCDKPFRSVDSKRTGSEIISIRHRCEECGEQKNKAPSSLDVQKFDHFRSSFEELISQYDLFIPQDEIPAEWDRQQEDCLHRKGFKKFADLFTKRNLVVSAYFFEVVEKQTEDSAIEERWFLNYLVSSLLRYTNNMSFSTSSWMDGRPVAWAKHAYWTPNQFIEVNPIEYYENRVKAFIAAIKDRTNRFDLKSLSFNAQDVTNGYSDYAILCSDSAAVELPNESVDFVLTDPPYGSNVQYGELCRFWQVWLRRRTPFEASDLSLSREAVVHRKTKATDYAKDFDDYYLLLRKVFSRCHYVLKPNGVMAFTFNNKDIRAWYAVVKASIDAGFFIEPEGIFFQEGIHAYRDTAHMRFDGTPQGDFIYSFRKTDAAMDLTNVPNALHECLDKAFLKVKDRSPYSVVELYINLFAESTLFMVKKISEGLEAKEVIDMFSELDLEQYIESNTKPA